MRARHSVARMVLFGTILGAFISLAAGEVRAQAGAAANDPAPFIGAWTLNREMTGPTPSPDVPDRREGRRGGGMNIGGFSGGRGSGPGAQGAGDARAEGQRLAALVQELVTPIPKLVIAREVGGMLSFTSGEGRSARYTPNNKTEKHQLTNGTIETKLRWNRGELRQEIAASDVLQLVRTFTIDASTDQLVVTTMFDGGNRDSDQRPFRVVYDRDER